MGSLLKKLLTGVTPTMLRSDSPGRPMFVRRRHWLLQETRFLFLTRRGPVEIIVKPSVILGAAFVGVVGLSVISAVTLFVGFKSVEVVRNESISQAVASAPVTMDGGMVVGGMMDGGNMDGGNMDGGDSIAATETPTNNAEENTGENTGNNTGTKLVAPANGAQAILDPAIPGDGPAPVEVANLTTAIPSVPWPPSSAATDNVRMPWSFLDRALLSEGEVQGDTAGDELALADNYAEPEEMVPVPSPLELPAGGEIDPVDAGHGFAVPFAAPDIIDLRDPGNPSAETIFQDDFEVVAMVTPPAASPSATEEREETGLVPFDPETNLPVITEASRQYKLLRSMAREVRGIRRSLSDIGLPEQSLPELGTLDRFVETADFASLAMAVEEHRSMLRKVPLKPPMLYFYISSHYGMRTHPVLKVRKFHHGIDLAGTWQETVHAPAPGTVIFAGRKGSFGKVVQVRHAYGLVTTYAHLAKITVRPGSDVVTGTVVGKMGRTGRVDGAHLHYEIRLGDKSIDPKKFFAIGHRIGVGGELMLAVDDQ